MPPLVKAFADWSNANQGIVTVSIFFTTLLLGWLSGIFAALKRRPRFRLGLITGPTFSCTFLTGQKQNGHDVHRSAFALYLHVTNVGSASGSIVEVHVGYHWHLRPFSFDWLRHTVGWFWLRDQTVVVEDFQASIGENLKVFPFLFQRSVLSGLSSDTFLQIGQSTNGVVYFEQSDSWGGCFPKVVDGSVRVKVRLIDAFGRSHCRKFLIPSVTMDEALKFNPSFGQTIAHIRGEIPAAPPELDEPPSV